MRPRRKDQQNRTKLTFLVFGLILYFMSWIIEFNFHFWQNLSHDIQAVAENSIWPASVTMMIAGILLIGFWNWRVGLTVGIAGTVLLVVIFIV